MDDFRVDRFARALAASANRRVALATLLGGIVAGSALDPADAACDHKQGKRKRHCRQRHHDHNNNGNGNGHGNGGGKGGNDCTVCASGCPFTSVQAAIDAASAGGTVTVCPGNYKENLTIEKNLTLVGSGNGVVLDGAKQGPVVLVQGSGAVIVTVAIKSVTITNGTGLTNPDNKITRGGGIAAPYESNLTLTDVIIQNNTAGAGGGIANGAYGTLTLDNTIVRQNVATSDDVNDPLGSGGGGIWNYGALVVGNDSLISGNQAFDGGAIFNIGDVTISGGSRLVNNQAANDGGGVYSAGGTIILDASMVTSNTAKGQGGGFFNNGNTRFDIQEIAVTIRNNADIRKNSAQNGGGIYNLPDDAGNVNVNVTISDSSIASNNASQSGGGVFNDGGTVSLQASTIFGNQAKQTGGGIFNTEGGAVTLDDQSAVIDNKPNNCVGTNACGA